MSYTKKTWSTGDTITADALNNLESGASANASAIAEIEKELPTYVGADVPRKAAETITPGTANQTIASGQYLAGAQTIKGDSNLVAANIKSGVSIFGVAGELANSGGAVSKSGTVTGNGGEQTIHTGLSNILAFLITSSNLPSATGLYYLVYMQNTLRATGVSKGQYFDSYYVTTDFSTASISGGRVTLKSSNGYYKPINNATYKWYAVGEA